MGDEAKNFLNRIPDFEGGIRRRIIAGGLLVVITMGLLSYRVIDLPPALATESLPIADILRSPTTVLLAFITIFALGSLIEMIGDVFIINILWGFLRLYRKRFLRKDVLVDLEKVIRKEARRNFRELPQSIQRSLANPLSTRFEGAWKFLQFVTDTEERQWLRSIRTRQKDILSIISTISVSLIALVFIPLVPIGSLRTLNEKKSALGEELRRRISLDGELRQARGEPSLTSIYGGISVRPEPGESRALPPPIRTETEVLSAIESSSQKIQKLESEIANVEPEVEARSKGRGIIIKLLLASPLLAILSIGYYLMIRRNVINAIEAICTEGGFHVEKEDG